MARRARRTARRCRCRAGPRTHGALPGLPSEPSLSTDLIVGSDAGSRRSSTATASTSRRSRTTGRSSGTSRRSPTCCRSSSATTKTRDRHRRAADPRLLLVIAAVVAAITLFVPFAVSRQRRRAPGAARQVALLRLLRLSRARLLFIEISMIQRFSLLLGFPTLSLSVSLFTLLIATAVGAGVGRGQASRCRWPAAAVAALAVVTAIYRVVRTAHRDGARQTERRGS